MGDYFRTAMAFLLRFITALGLPWVWIVVFQGQGTVEFFLAWALWTVFLGGIAHYSKRKYPGLYWLSSLFVGLLLLAGGLIFFTMAAFSPLEAYLTWLKALKAGPAPGAVAFHLGILLGFVTTLLSALSWGVGFRGPSFFLALLLSGGAWLLGYTVLGLVGALGSLVALGILAVRGNQPRASGGRIFLESLFLPLTVLLISLPLAAVPFRTTAQAPKALAMLQPLAEEFVNPEIWALVEDQEGLGSQMYAEALPSKIRSPLFRVRGTPRTPYYFRAQIFDFFTGTQWQRYPQVNRAPWKNLRIRPGFAPPLELEVTAELLPLIPHTLNTREIQVHPAGASGPVMAQLMPQGVRLETPLRRGDRIFLERGTGGPWVKDPQREMNLQGLQNLSFPVLAFFQDQKWEPETPAPASALQVRRFLLDNYSYILKNPGGSGPPLERFLLGEKAGWSSHFASAAVMMLRYRGVPARLVKGYLALTDERGAAEVTTLHQHQWAEFYWEKYGWIPLEVCPPFQPESLAEVPGPGRPGDQRTWDQIAAVTGQGAEPAKNWGSLVWSGSLILMGTLTLLGVFRRKVRDWFRREKPVAEVLPAPLENLVRLGLKRGTGSGPERQGWLLWCRQWKGIRPWVPARLEKLVLSRQYGTALWTPRDLLFLKALARSARKRKSGLTPAQEELIPLHHP